MKPSIPGLFNVKKARLVRVAGISQLGLKRSLRDTAAEKEFDIVIQMTLEHVVVQRFEKKEMDKNVF